MIATLVDKVLKQLFKVVQMRRLRNQEKVLQKTFKELGSQIFIDIFATRVNRQCTRYCSISKDKCAGK
ncbi:MAG: hypothetical protein EZS28_055105 [Streblomastix strix]|uniref:Uncharacterized protein n=1 Tax=Streblomastix strix TaxID=222440 RepID=A0A5J4Q9L7_9EUKA|nr:MAG: hypothetical protein EZS28_055105 [Streblomastix strix]